jgi:hypothetical protein
MEDERRVTRDLLDTFARERKKSELQKLRNDPDADEADRNHIDAQLRQLEALKRRLPT